jgi:hypothetical protein
MPLRPGRERVGIAARCILVSYVKVPEMHPSQSRGCLRAQHERSSKPLFWITAIAVPPDFAELAGSVPPRPGVAAHR